jgi:3-hydroxyacyl-CoA dehydrogenase
MGAALVRAFAKAGYATRVMDSSPDAARKVAEATAGAEFAASTAELAACDLVIDAVFEDMDVKRGFFAAIDAAASAAPVLVSNTSYLDLEAMSEGLTHRNRFIGMHFFNPADRNSLVEVIPLPFTDPEVTATIAAVATRLGKSPIRAGNADGFVANRVYAEYRTQVEFMVEDGAAPQEVDAALVEFGLAMGPFAVADMSGLDIAWSRRKRLADARDTRERYVHIADSLCEAGRLGRKSGAGWYRYPDGATRGSVDPVVDQLVAQARSEAGRGERRIAAQEIVDRAAASMVFASADLVMSGVALRASDIDVALTEGFGFPKYTGGPLRHVSTWPLERQTTAFEALYRSDPVRYASLEHARTGLPERIESVLADSKPC